MAAANRNTIQRKLVMNVVQNSLHPTAEYVYKTIKTDYPDISLGTVYRNLSLLSNRGDILKIPLPGSADRFDRDISLHYHAVCSECGAIDDVHGLDLGDIDMDASQNTGYTISGHTLIFTGICPECQAKISEQSLMEE